MTKRTSRKAAEERLFSLRIPKYLKFAPSLKPPKAKHSY